MEKTMYMLLTDANLRDSKDVESHLMQELSVGAPWFDKAPETD